MSEVSFWFDNVANALFELLGTWKAVVSNPFPYKGVVDSDFEYPASPRGKRYFAKTLAKGLEKLLRHPCRTQQPVALGAIADDDSRFVCHVFFGLALIPGAI